MSRTISTDLLKELYKTQTDEIFLSLLRLSHPDWGSDIYLVSDSEDVVSNGNTYTSFPFNVSLPTEDAEKPQSSTTLTACAVDRSLIEILRGVSSEITAYLSFTTKSDPDTLIYGESRFIIPSASYTDTTITASLTLEPILSEPIPKDTFTPTQFPGLF